MILTVLVDLDAIVADSLKKWLALYNKDYDDNLTVAGVTEYDISKAVKPEACKTIYDYIRRHDFFDNLEPIEGAIKVLSRLRDDGHNVVILSAPASNPLSAAKKITWAQEHLKVKRQQVMLGHLKHLVKGDVFIDDSPDNIVSYRMAWPDAHVLTIEYPYNREVHELVNLMASDYENTKQAWQQIDEYISNLAKSDT